MPEAEEAYDLMTYFAIRPSLYMEMFNTEPWLDVPRKFGPPIPRMTVRHLIEKLQALDPDMVIDFGQDEYLHDKPFNEEIEVSDGRVRLG